MNATELRLLECLACEHRSDEWKCDSCGCDIRDLTRRPLAKCPVNKWQPIEGSTE